MDEILVGYDGSDHARDALTLAGSLALTTGAAVTLAWAIHELPDIAPVRDVRSKLRDAARRALERAAGRLPAGIEAHTRVVEGRSLSGALSLLAEGQGVSSIVVGSSHRGPIGRVLAGSFGRQVLDAAPCPVAVAPPGLHAHGACSLSVVAVGYDAQPESGEALQMARGLAQAASCAVRVIGVAEPPRLRLTGAALRELEHALQNQTQRAVAEAVDVLSPAVAAEGRVLSGPVTEALVREVQSGTDLLVVGSRGFGPVERVLLGSVSARLIHSCPCPLLVVPRSGAVD